MRRYHVTTFGCQMNAHDSERIKGMLEELGLGEAVSPDDADVVVFNTCTIREKPDTKLAAYLGAAAARRDGFERVADFGLHLTEAAALAAGVSALGKGIAGRELPDVPGSERPGNFSFGRGFHAHSGRFVSFPAGHATVAFASAAVITSEAERWRPELRWPVGVATYGAATLVAVTRMYQNRHWASDNPIAAVIGTWTGLTVVRRQHSGSRSRMDRWLLGLSAAPTSQGGFVVGWSGDLRAP